MIREKRKEREQHKNITIGYGTFCVLCVIIPGLLPFTLWAALRAFKNFPEIFVADK